MTMDRHDQDPHHERRFDGIDRPFPSEAEWLDLPAPPISADFVARVVAAVSTDAEVAAERPGTIAGHLLTPTLLNAYAAPEPTADFVARTLQAVADDRRRHWRDLLARYVAPEPSAAFVQRTLRALAAERPAAPTDQTTSLGPTAPLASITRRGRWRASVWFTMLAAAAALVVAALAWPTDRTRPTFGPPVATAPRPAFAAHVGGELASVLARAERDAEPLALASGGADGTWLLWQRRQARGGGR